MAKRYNANDTMEGRTTGGPYLDRELAKEANTNRRAQGDTKTAEGAFAAFAGVELVTAKELLKRHPAQAVDNMTDAAAEAAVKAPVVVA